MPAAFAPLLCRVPRRVLPLALLALLSSVCVLRAQQPAGTNNGDLTVTGSLDVNGNLFNLGAWSNDATKFGLNLTYSEDDDQQATLSLSATRPAAVWLWQRSASAGNPGQYVPQMSLDSTNTLSLYDPTSPTPNAAVVLSPTGTSTFQSSVSFNGTNNLMPNQRYTGSASVLTVGLADARYQLVNRGNNLTLGAGATAGGSQSVALGYQATASATATTALGDNATASGPYSIVLGPNGVASGFASVALGNATVASGYYATALGVSSSAAGQNAVALGVYAQANGDFSTSLGTGSIASGAYAMALGETSRATGFGGQAVGRFSFATGALSVAVGTYAVAQGEEASAYSSSSLAGADQSTTLGFASGTGGTGATALGFHSAANGNYAVSLGSFSNAGGAYATALTSSSNASGDYAVAAGTNRATGFYQFAVGRYGTDGGDPHQWVATDALFTVGNGSAPDAPSNALVVQKNGNATFQGVVTVAPGGDIPMYMPPGQ